jgi:hypothetical protein
VAQETQSQPELEEILGRVAQVTQSLLEDGAKPSQVAFALASVAADMGLQVAGDPLKVFPVLLEAIADVAKARLEAETQSLALEVNGQEPPEGATIH